MNEKKSCNVYDLELKRSSTVCREMFASVIFRFFRADCYWANLSLILIEQEHKRF